MIIDAIRKLNGAYDRIPEPFRFLAALGLAAPVFTFQWWGEWTSYAPFIWVGWIGFLILGRCCR